jgi:hypothetical protein
MRNRIAKYKTEHGAERYACDLRAAWPQYGFKVEPHPREFGFAVMLCDLRGRRLAYVLARPHNALHSLGYTGK